MHVFAEGERGADYASGWHFHTIASKPTWPDSPFRTPTPPTSSPSTTATRSASASIVVGRRVIAEHYGASEQGA